MVLLDSTHYIFEAVFKSVSFLAPNICSVAKSIHWLTFNPGLALTGFRTTWPRWIALSTFGQPGACMLSNTACDPSCDLTNQTLDTWQIRHYFSRLQSKTKAQRFPTMKSWVPCALISLYEKCKFFQSPK